MESLKEDFAYVEYGFYALLGVMAVAFIVVPIWKVICMPSLPDMDVNEGDPLRKTRKLAKRLVGTKFKAVGDFITKFVRSKETPAETA